MKTTTRFILLTTALAQFSLAALAADEAGFKSIFNGKDLTGWEGRKEHWSVQDGAITGTTTQTPARGNNFLIWRGGTVDDFELRLSYKIVANNDKNFGDSGIQYRSKELPDFVVSGYQANLMVTKPLTGVLYEEKGRGIVHQLGQKIVLKADPDDPKKHKVEVVGSFGKSEEIQASFKSDDWNDYVIIAKGNHLQQFINGKQTADVTDEDEVRAAKSGILALQLHAGLPMTVQFKDIRIKTLAAAKAGLDAIQGNWRLAEIVANGQPAKAEDITSIKLVVQDKGYTVEKSDGSERDHGTFELGEGHQPRWMDITTKKGDQIPAIYEIIGDTMRVCYALNGTPRPADFSGTGSDRVMAVYKRN